LRGLGRLLRLPGAAMGRGGDALLRLRLRRRGRRRGLDGDLGVADLDLRTGRQAAVVGGEVDVEGGDGAVEGRGRTAVRALPVRGRVAPVGERDAAAGGGLA